MPLTFAASLSPKRRGGCLSRPPSADPYRGLEAGWALLVVAVVVRVLDDHRGVRPVRPEHLQVHLRVGIDARAGAAVTVMDPGVVVVAGRIQRLRRTRVA